MAMFTKFEDITAWQKARELSALIFKVTETGKFAKDFALKTQILRSSGSVMDNIAEGFERGGRKEFVQFLGIAKGSCGEVKSQIYRSIDFGYIDKTQFDNLYALTDETSKMISGLMKYLNTSTVRGLKFKT
ncbi:MAG: four helix bundle protein [Bacteroidetes bacterium]|nr:MAG: four helix bundle protein [Bacteroidota bacterium]